MKNLFFDDLNKDQLDRLSELCFSFAKGAFVLIVYPAEKRLENLTTESIRISAIFVIGLAFLIVGLVLLKIKENVKK